jgi:hypothetical protein
MPHHSSSLSTLCVSSLAPTKRVLAQCHLSGSALPVLLLVAVALFTTGCKELLGLKGNCCCFPTTSSAKNDGKVVDPSQCSNPDDYCAGNSTDNSAPERQAYAQHCGGKASLFDNGGSVAFMSPVGFVLPEVCLRGTVASQPRTELVPRKRREQQDPSQCESECKEDGPFCLKVNLEDQSALLSKVEQSRVLIMNQQDQPIKTSQFMQIFGINTDPCLRKDTILSSGQLTNNGDRCYLNSSISNGTDSFKFTVQLPPTLQGTRSVVAQRVILTFQDAAKSPALIIGNPDLNRDFGGRVQRAAADGTTGVVSTERGCIAVRTQASHE